MRSVFADTGYFIALLSDVDALHSHAKNLATTLAEKHIHVFTSQAVMIETLDGFARHNRRTWVSIFVRELTDDPDVTVIPVTPERFRAGLDLFTSRIDKTWGMTDCISFAIMRERKLKQALTADKHFVQAGFEALLM
jgi:predicted nucleic acid-binding protein